MAPSWRRRPRSRSTRSGGSSPEPGRRPSAPADLRGDPGADVDLRLVVTATERPGVTVAAQLVLSHRTVQNHVQNTLGKLHLHNRVELVRFALAHGLEDE